MSTETQTFADLMVLGMTDEAALQSIEYHIKMYEDGLIEHGAVAGQLITALDNVYGRGSYIKYTMNGIMPSAQ